MTKPDLADEITIAPGEILFHEKTFAGTMYICVEGELVGFRNNVEAGRFRSGGNFGKNAFLVDSTHFLTCRAKTRTRLLEIHRQEFDVTDNSIPHRRKPWVFNLFMEKTCKNNCHIIA